MVNSKYLKTIRWFTKAIFILAVLIITYAIITIWNTEGLSAGVVCTFMSLIVLSVLYFVYLILKSINPYILIGISYLIFLPFKGKYNSKIETQINFDKAQIVEYKQQLADVESKIEEIALYLRSECVIPEPYWVYANELCSLIQVRRANDLTSAINLLEDIFYKLRMENTQLQQIDMLKCNTEELQKIKESIRNIHITTSTYVKVTSY